MPLGGNGVDLHIKARQGLAATHERHYVDDLSLDDAGKGAHFVRDKADCAQRSVGWWLGAQALLMHSHGTILAILGLSVGACSGKAARAELGRYDLRVLRRKAPAEEMQQPTRRDTACKAALTSHSYQQEHSKQARLHLWQLLLSFHGVGGSISK